MLLLSLPLLTPSIGPSPALLQGPRVGGPPAALPPGARPPTRVHELLPTEHDTTNVDITAAACGDLDGDGDLDVVLGLCLLGDWGHEPMVNLLLLNEGGARFEPGRDGLPHEPDIPLDIGAADVDGDGDVDLLLTNDNSFTGQSGPDHLYRNLGGARFANASGALVPGSDRGLVRFGDVDGDGDPDLLHPRTSSGLPELHANQGGSFVDVSAALPGGSGFLDGRFGDVDGDGDLDVLLTASARTALWLNDGTGLLVDASAGRVPLTLGAAQFELGDLDGDSDLDLGSFARVLRNDGTGIFTNQAVPNGLRPPLALADVDGDDDLDLFGPARLLLNDGGASFADASNRLPIHEDVVGTFVAGDLDGDADVDALAAEYGTYFGSLPQRAEFLLLNDGGANFTDSRTLPDALTRSPAGPAALGLLDGDPFADLVLDWYDGTQSRLQILDGDGTGRFGSPTNLPRPSGWLYELGLARVDGDPENDLVLAGDAGVKVLYGPSFGLTGTPIVTQASGTEPGDFDGDGDTDLVTREAAPANNRLLLQGAPRSFALASTASFPRLPAEPTAVDSLDAESDGDLDVVFAQSSVKLYANQGAAAFVNVTATHVPGGAALAVSAGDLDGDGTPDLLTGTFGDQRMFSNTGDGHFVARPDRIPAEPGAPYGHLLVDMDGDGDLDALEGYWGTVLENDGRGRLQRRRPVGFLLRPAAGDVDGDGDLDVLAVGNGTDDDAATGVILRNRARQLAWLTLPSIGEPLVLEVSGTPFEPYALFAAAGRGQVATAFGTLWLQPSSIVEVSSGRVGMSGSRRCTFLVPPTTALIGTTRYWQALVGRSPRFTNLEATTFTDL